MKKDTSIEEIKFVAVESEAPDRVATDVATDVAPGLSPARAALKCRPKGRRYRPILRRHPTRSPGFPHRRLSGLREVAQGPPWPNAEL
jgi:hypothetical protein